MSRRACMYMMCINTHVHAFTKRRERKRHPYTCKPGTLEALEPVFNERVVDEEGETAATVGTGAAWRGAP